MSKVGISDVHLRVQIGLLADIVVVPIILTPKQKAPTEVSALFIAKGE